MCVYMRLCGCMNFIRPRLPLPPPLPISPSPIPTSFTAFTQLRHNTHIYLHMSTCSWCGYVENIGKDRTRCRFHRKLHPVRSLDRLTIFLLIISHGVKITQGDNIYENLFSFQLIFN